MIKLGQLHAITLKEDYTLLAGFYRFCVAFELGWKTIRAKIYFNISEYDEILIEIIENNNRKDFASYDFYVVLGKIKKKHENAHPETKRGRYIRSHSENEDHKSIAETVSVMGSQSNNSVPSFVKAHYEIFGLTERGLRNKTRISNALENNKFDSKTVDLLKQGKITQKELLEKLRKVKNRQIIKDKLKESLNININYPQKKRPSEKKHYNESNERQITDTEIKKFVSTMQKPIIDKFVETGKKISSKDSKSLGLKDTNTSLVESSKEDNQVTPLVKTLNQDKKITEISEEKSDIKKDKLTKNNYCNLCGKASVIAVECEKCGHMTPKVICDDSFNSKVLIEFEIS